MTENIKKYIFISLIFAIGVILGWILCYTFSQDTYQSLTMNSCQHYITHAQQTNTSEFIAFMIAPSSCGDYNTFVGEWKTILNYAVG